MQKTRAYAFRGWPDGQPGVFEDMEGAKMITSSAPFSENIALELGDRVAEAGFFQACHQAWLLTPWVGK